MPLATPVPTLSPPTTPETIITAERDEARFNIRLTLQDQHVLDILAERTGIATRSELIRLALHYLLDNWPGGPRPPSASSPSATSA